MSEPRETAFEQAARQDRGPGLLAEFCEFLRHNKKWWLLPILIVLLAMGLLIALSASPLSPFIYTLI